MGKPMTRLLARKLRLGSIVRELIDFTMLQTDYGIRIASIAGGTLRLRDELKISFYVVARKQV